MLLAGLRPGAAAMLKNVGFQSWFPAEHVFPEEDREFSATLKAVRFAHAKAADRPAVQPDLYYLV